MQKRYIEVYKLMEFANNQKDKTIDANDIARFPFADVVDKEQYNRLLENATILAEALNKYWAADATERKKGKWIEDGYWSEGVGMGESYGDYFKCSVCEERVRSGYKHCYMNFCPYCGSDNREGSNNEISN